MFITMVLVFLNFRFMNILLKKKSKQNDRDTCWLLRKRFETPSSDLIVSYSRGQRKSIIWETLTLESFKLPILVI